MHTAVDLVNETKLDAEIKSWLAFAAQKVVEVDALAKALAGQKDEVCLFFSLCSLNWTLRVSSSYKIMLTLFILANVIYRLTLRQTLPLRRQGSHHPV